MRHILTIILSFLCVSQVGCAQILMNSGEKELIEAFVNLKDVAEPFAEKHAELKAKYDASEIRELRQLALELQKTYSYIGQDTPDTSAIPYLIALIDADNSYDTEYWVGHFALGRITDVEYSPFQDGAFWKRWWKRNKANFPEEIQSIAIPELPKTRFGRTYQPFPDNTDTLAGQLLALQATIRHALTLSRDKKSEAMLPVSLMARSIVRFNDPTAIPYFIAMIDADNTYGTFYGIGYYGLGNGRPALTDVQYSQSHDGTWWKKWWAENKHKYPEGVQNIPIPSIHDEWNIPDLSKEVALWRQEKEETQKREHYEKMQKELAESDVGDVPAERLCVEGNEKMEYFLIGVDKAKVAPESGYHLVIVLPGGNGSADFHPFVRRIWKYAMDNSNFIIAQPIAVRWTPNQQITWATENNKVDKQEFSTELFVESVVADVAKRVKIDPRYIFTLSWSSGGPAAYTIALQEKTAITGSYIVMSVFKPEQLPPLKNAKGRSFAIQHSPEDRVCPFRMAKEAEVQLTEHGARVKFMEYTGGHGWHGNVYGRIRENLAWLKE